MSVPVGLPWKQYTGNGSTTEFAFPYRWYTDADVVVLLTDAAGVVTTQTIGAGNDYTLAGKSVDPSDGLTGAVTMLTPPAGGGTPEKLTIYDETAIWQNTKFGNIAAFQSLPAEIQMDLLVKMIMRLELFRQRTSTYGITNTDTPPSLESLLLLISTELITVLDAKSSVVDADLLRLGDSADSFSEKKILASVLKTYMYLAPVLGGDLNANGKDIHSLALATFSVNAIGNSGATKTVDWNDGAYQTITLTADCTLTFTAPSTYPARLQLDVTQDSTGSWDITWPASVEWAGGAAPTITPTATTGNDIITLVYDGTNYKAVPAQNFS